MNLTTKTEYGLRALQYLRDKSDEGPVNISEISNSLNLSKTYIEQIFRKLKNAGILKSTRGKDGGYQLAYSPDKIVLGYVIRILEGNINLVYKCEVENCVVENCPSRDVFEKIDFAVANVIDKMTLDQL